MTAEIRVSAVVIRNPAGEVLTVRKRGTSLLMFPGGKPEPGESAAQAAVREAEEELGVALDEAALRPLGEYVADAANEPGRRVRATLFEHPYVEVAAPRAEIEHLEWADPTVPRHDLAPLMHATLFAAPAQPGRQTGLSAR